MFTGSITALLTPFQNGAVDEKKFAEFVDWQIAEGTKGLVPCGTTGESPTLSHDEHRRVTEICIDVASRRVPVIAGCGSNSTSEAISLTRHAKKAGADGALVVTPYYNKPTQEGLYQHFRAVHDAADIPIIIYNIPGRSVVNMSIGTMAKLAKLPNIVGVKDATGDLARVPLQRVGVGKDFVQLSGEDQTALAFMAHGGQGCISVTSNILPRLLATFQDHCLKGNYAAALEIQDQLTPIHEAMFMEASPGPVKYAAQLMGILSDEMRLPMAPVAEATKQQVRKVLIDAGFLEPK